ncbi:MAG: winged helix-turn-helix domain-containing protein, partial [Candidatus Cybelea sp.]
MSVYEFGPFQLDEARLLLLDRGVPLPIGPKVVETLLALLEHPGEVFPKNELLARIWPEGYVDEANLAQNIYVLRKTLRGRWNAAAIETIPRRGYRFTAPVRRREDL